MPITLASSHCQFCGKEWLSCSKPSFDTRRSPTDFSSISFRCRDTFLGGMQSYWLRDLPLLKVRVAADYSDSLPDSTKDNGDRGYHPLEELKESKKKRDVLLTEAELARTTVEANNKALLVFPSRVHREPHEHVSWAEFQYVVDDYGDIFFEFFDDENILEDRRASNPVAVLIGMENSICGENRAVTGNYIGNLETDNTIDILFDDDYEEEIVNTEVTDTLIKWGMPETLRLVHPMYFAKCLAKSVRTKYGKLMDCPSNGISIVGCLRPAFMDQDSYLRRLFQREDDDDDGYMSDWSDDVRLRFNSDRDRSSISSTIYKLEINSMELFSVYGDQSMINVEDFQDAEPDVLAHSSSAIIERFSQYGAQCSLALKTLCRKRKGLTVERAHLIGVDSLGMDVRVSSGVEAQTLRFSFNARAISETAAEKKIKRMLFPRYQRKSSKTPCDAVQDLTSL